MEQPTKPTPYSLTGERPYPWIRWWYTIAAPPTPPNSHDLPLAGREFLRRGKLTSVALLTNLIIQLFSIGPAFQSSVATAAGKWSFLLCFLAVVLAVGLNRAGKIVLAGILLIISLEVVQNVTSLMAQPHGLDIEEVTFIFLLLYPLMMSVLVLPTWGVLATAAANVVITLVLFFGPTQKTSALLAFLNVNGGGGLVSLVATSIILQAICAVISAVVVASLRESLVRADRAEEITKLQHILAQHALQEVQKKQQLEADAAMLMTGLTRFANGDSRVRLRVEHEGVLQTIAENINQVLGRLVRLREQEFPLEQTCWALRAHLASIRQSRAGRSSLEFQTTGTEADTLVQELIEYLESQGNASHVKS